MQTEIWWILEMYSSPKLIENELLKLQKQGDSNLNCDIIKLHLN